MSSKLHISSSGFTLPIDVVTRSVSVLAQKGAGKTYLSKVLAEEMLEKQQQVVIIDPTGAWWGLKSSADGKKPGFPITILGGDHADIPLKEHMAEAVAHAIVERRLSVVLDLSEMHKGAMIRFVGKLLEIIYRLNKEPLHLIVDEADLFAPQKQRGGFEPVTLGAMEDIVRRGRKKGIGCTVITQRPAVINKDVLTQTELLVVLRLNSPNDIRPIREWVELNGAFEVVADMIKSLPSLQTGTAFFWSPYLQIFEKVTIRKAATFDSSATPKVGEKRLVPTALAVVDIKALGEHLEKAAAEIKANSPDTLKAQVAELQAKLRAQGKVAEPDPKALQKAEDYGFLNGWYVGFGHARKLLTKLGEEMQEVDNGLRSHSPEHFRQLAEAGAKGLPRPKLVHPPEPKTPPILGPSKEILAKIQESRAPDAFEGLRDGPRKLMTAIAQRPGMDKRQLCIRAGVSPKSSATDAHIAFIRKQGWVHPGTTFTATQEGLAALGTYEQLPVGPELLAHWLRKLDAGPSDVLRAFSDAYPEALTKAAMCERVGISTTSSATDAKIAYLRKLELIDGDGRGGLRMSDELA